MQGCCALKSGSATSYRPDVDGLRAIAVLAVIGFHAFPKRIPGGFIGVDVFFVISGFLISGIILAELRRGTFSYLEFYRRRIRRIFPALLLVLATSLIVGWFLLLPDDFKELGKESAASAAFGANLLFWSQSGYFDVSAAGKPLLHLWSLGVEEQFYIAWPLLLAWFYRRSARLLLILAGLMCASFALNIALMHEDPSASFYLPVTRFWELLAGALLACAAKEQNTSALRQHLTALHNNPFWREILAWFGMVLMAPCLWLLTPTAAFPGWWAVLPVLGTFCVLAARDSWLSRVLLSNRAMVFVGLISYPLYLWHWVALTFVHLRFQDGAGVAPTSQRLAAVGASFVLAWATYRLVERPIRFGAHPAIGSLTLLILMSVAGLSGLVVNLSDGGAWRYPPDIRPLAAFDYDRARDETETAYRADRCFLGRTQTFSELAAECVDPPRGPAQLIVLWGDSHAAALYPGLKMLRDGSGSFRIAQFTASLCPPLLGESFRRRPNCRDFNDSVIRRLAQLRPGTVMLMAHWRNYAAKDSDENPLDFDALAQTVARLRAIGVGRIIVIGSLPEWSIAQPRVSLCLWRDTGAAVYRSNAYLDPALAGVDAAVQNAAVAAGATFLSPRRALCNATGCLLSSSPRALSPLAWDTGHLTIPGSELLMGLLSPDIAATPAAARASQPGG